MMSDGIRWGYNALIQLRQASVGCATVDAAFASACRASTAQAKLQTLAEDLVEARLVSFASVCLVNERTGSFGLVAISGSGADYFPPVLEETTSLSSSPSPDGSPSASMDGLQRSSQRSFSLFMARSFALHHSGWAVEDVVRTHAPWFLDCSSAGTRGLPKEGEWLKRSGLQSVLAVPCMHDGKVVAVLLLGAAHTCWHPMLLSKLQALAHSITPFAVTAGEQVGSALGSSKLRRFQSMNGIAASMTYELINLDKILAARLVGPSALVSPGEAAAAVAACREAGASVAGDNAQTNASATLRAAAAAAAAAHALDVSMRLPPILMHPVNPASPSTSTAQSSSCGCKEQQLNSSAADMHVLLGDRMAAAASPMYTTSQRQFFSKQGFACAETSVATPAASAATPNTGVSSPAWRPEPAATTTTTTATSCPTLTPMPSQSKSLVHDLLTFQMTSPAMPSSHAGLNSSSMELSQTGGVPTLRHVASNAASNSASISASRLQKVTHSAGPPTEQHAGAIVLHSVDGDFELEAGPCAPWHARTSLDVPDWQGRSSRQHQSQAADVLGGSFWSAVQGGALEGSPVSIRMPHSHDTTGMWPMVPADDDTGFNMAARLAGSAAYVAAYATSYIDSAESTAADAAPDAAAAALCASHHDASSNRSTSELRAKRAQPWHLTDLLSGQPDLFGHVSAKEPVAPLTSNVLNASAHQLHATASPAATDLAMAAVQRGHVMHGSAHLHGLSTLPAGSRFMIAELEDPAASPHSSHAQDGGSYFMNDELMGQQPCAPDCQAESRSWAHAQAASHSSMPLCGCISDAHPQPRQLSHGSMVALHGVHAISGTYLPAGASVASSNLSTLHATNSVRHSYGFDPNNLSNMSNASTHWLARTHGLADLCTSSTCPPAPSPGPGRTVLNSLPENPAGYGKSVGGAGMHDLLLHDSKHAEQADPAAGWAQSQTSDFAVMLQ